MQFSYAAIAAALVASVSAYSNTTSASVYWVTDVVTSYTTYCPAATTLTYNNVTYTATKGETITVTNCPCTLSHQVTATPAPSASVTKPAGPAFTAGANNMAVGSAAGIAGIFGLAALLL